MTLNYIPNLTSYYSFSTPHQIPYVNLTEKTSLFPKQAVDLHCNPLEISLTRYAFSPLDLKAKLKYLLLCEGLFYIFFFYFKVPLLWMLVGL